MRNAEKEQNELDELYGEVVHGIAEKGTGQIKGEDRLKGQGTTVDYKGLVPRSVNFTGEYGTPC